jgi:Skp family chaperone for outer membrane proteins
MQFTFVDSPDGQMDDEQPAKKSSLISDKSTAAKDRVDSPGKSASQTPHVEQPGVSKQVGQLIGAPSPDPQPAPPVNPSVRKAEPVQESPSPEATQHLHEEYEAKIRKLQEQITVAQAKIEKNEEILQRRKKMQEEEKKLLRQNQPQQPAPSPRGRVGFGGASLHGASSDVKGDVDRFGELSFDAERYELGSYFKKMKTKVEEFWLPYMAFTYGGSNLFANKTVVFFRIQPDGSVKDVQVLEHKGDKLLKEFCLASVQGPAPFDPLPENYLRQTRSTYLPIVFSFSY